MITSHAFALAIGGRPETAVAMLTDAALRWPDNVLVQGQLARLRWMLGDEAGFAQSIETSVNERPAHAALRAEAARLVSLAGDAPRAESLLRAAPAIELPVAKGLVAVLSDQGRVEEALALTEKFPQLVGERAMLLLRLGRGDEALVAARQIPRRARIDQQAVALEATALRLVGDPGYRRLYDYDAMVRTFEIEPPGGDIATFNAELAQALRARHTTSVHPLDQTLRGGTQTGGDLRYAQEPILRAFFAALDAPIRAYIAAMRPDDPLGQRRRTGYKFDGCWSVRLRPGGFHVNHVHGQGWISSAYYVTMPPTEGDEGAIKFGEPLWDLPGCGPEKIVRPKPGLLVLFPSYMWHGTVPFTGGEERLTVAFDVIPT